MSTTQKPQGDQRTAQSLGLKVPVYRHLRDALAENQHPSWLQLADPALAGAFPNPLGFELLLDHMQEVISLERRRANLLRTLEDSDNEALRAQLQDAADEGELEDIALTLHPAEAPSGSDDESLKDEQKEYLQKLRGQSKVAALLRSSFRTNGVMRVELLEGKESELRPFQQFADKEYKISDVPENQYLTMRRGEHAHALKLHFALPSEVVPEAFALTEFPPQEKDGYFALFRKYVDEEKVPRLLQEARARLKKRAESYALQHAWGLLEMTLDRGLQKGKVLGIFAQRNGKLSMALSNEGHFLRAATFSAKDDQKLAESITQFMGEDRPEVVALQADSPTRTYGNKALDVLRKEGKLRSLLVPVAVVRTLLREVARSFEESHLQHDERQAFMLARFGQHPRAAAYHTPHIVRAFIQNRGEVNHHRLDTFTEVFLQSLIVARGVDLNSASHDELHLVPGIDAKAVEIERSTGPFCSLLDFKNRMGLCESKLRPAFCFLRVRGGDDPLDAKPLHPIYYGALREATSQQEEASNFLKEPTKLQDLEWDEILKARGWTSRVVPHVIRGLSKTSRRPRFGHRGPQAGKRLESLEVGATVSGKITKILEHGAFVEIGMRREGFVHVSQLADQFVKDPKEVVEVGQEVSGRVVSIDLEKQRFRVSLRSEEGSPRGSGGKGKGKGKGRGKGDGRERRAPLPAHAKDMRPKSRPGGGKGGRDDRRKKIEKVQTGKDPQAGRWKEDIDPTNPFYEFFKQQSEGEQKGENR